MGDDMKKSFIISGYTSANFIIRVHHLPKVGMTEIVQNKDNSTLYFGGNGLNVAVYLAQLGLNAMPILRGGSDYSAQGYPDFLAENGVSDRAVSIVPNDVTGVCYLAEDDQNDHMTFFYPGAMDGKYAPSAYDDAYFDGVDWGIMTVASRADNELFLQAMHDHKIPMAFVMRPDPDAFPPQFLNRILYSAKLVFMNEMERSYIKETLGFDPAEELLRKGNAEAVIETTGAAGCRVYTMNSGIINCDEVAATKPDAVIDTTGAGDSFLAGFMYGVVHGFNYTDCAKYGATISSFIIEASGCLTNVPNEKQLLERVLTRRTDIS